jgi:hypothetical protein
MLPNDRQLMVVTDGLQADMDMVVVQETIIRRTILDYLEKSELHAPSYIKLARIWLFGMITLPDFPTQVDMI